jgi:hypothetical protein
MTGATMVVPYKSCSTSTTRLTTRNAWAAYARSRWPQNTLAMIQREWGLSVGEARGGLYAQISQAVIDRCLDHPKNGGALLALDLLLLRFRLQATDLAEKLEEKHTHERQREGARRESERRALSRLAVVARGSEAEVVTFAPKSGGEE